MKQLNIRFHHPFLTSFVLSRKPIDTHSCKPRELMPASLLLYRQTWPPLVHTLPMNSCVIVIDLNNQPQHDSMLCLVQQVRRREKVVYLLSVGNRGYARGSEA
jgi:hypothetical protein